MLTLELTDERFAWSGGDRGRRFAPDVVVQGNQVFVSWIEATEVAQRWTVAGEDESRAEPVATVDRDGPETAIPLEPGVPYVTVEALDDNGQVLATSTSQV